MNFHSLENPFKVNNFVNTLPFMRKQYNWKKVIMKML